MSEVTQEKELCEGEVIWFNDKLGYGFVKPVDGGDDLFVHYTNIVSESGKFKTLVAGQSVVYTIGNNNTGPQAENVVIVSAEDDKTAEDDSVHLD
jgi:CspA family cold shock protein